MLRAIPGALLIAVVLGTGAARAQGDFREALQRAEDHYQVKEYDVALDLVDRILMADTSGGTLRLQATVLKARCLTRLGQTAAARTAFQETLALDSDWRPDANLMRQDELALFDDVLAAHREEQRLAALPECVTPTKPLVATGALAAGLAWYLTAKSSADDKWDAYAADPLRPQDLYDDYESAKSKQDIAAGVSIGTGVVAGYLWWRYLHSRGDCRDRSAAGTVWDFAPGPGSFVVTCRF